MPERLQAMMDILSLGIEKEASVKPVVANSQGIAFLPLQGIIEQHNSFFLEFFGGTSTDMFGRMFDSAVNDPLIRTIVIDVDSPGGSVYGVQELSDKIYAARTRKHIIAVANSLMASAAYWIASAAHEIVAMPSSEIGSIGVVAVHQDISKYESDLGIKTTIIKAGKYKAEGNMHEPLDNEALNAIQSRIDDYYKEFVGAVARNRNVGVGKVLSDFGQGRVFGSQKAKYVKMIDRVGTMEDEVGRIIGQRITRNKNAMALEIAKI
jgi:signal peptide peptidase SppA